MEGENKNPSFVEPNNTNISLPTKFEDVLLAMQTDISSLKNDVAQIKTEVGLIWNFLKEKSPKEEEKRQTDWKSFKKSLIIPIHRRPNVQQEVIMKLVPLLNQHFKSRNIKFEVHEEDSKHSKQHLALLVAFSATDRVQKPIENALQEFQKNSDIILVFIREADQNFPTSSAGNIESGIGFFDKSIPKTPCVIQLVISTQQEFNQDIALVELKKLEDVLYVYKRKKN